ncbi:hypothetical protein EJ04DRAFT_543488 [Polyplosphaeria fusca]|uniref:Uncharacterized protein n=1 Tax=Polyplosphaeria fusca TaxID=682080 RepID=A0A9P4QXN6_9PLEO|nr:hypothetical protein EJ04DRAFT_543488 [Polyplosphaeria fusca]
MHDEHPHALLAQVPLTLSPFLSLPTATPLPYTYKQLPSTLPPSILSSQNQTPNPSTDNNSSSTTTTTTPAYVTSASGTTATPDQILSSCLALQQHLSQLESSAKQTLRNWEDARRAADLAEKRRVAPGWLDGQVKLLVPEGEGRGGEAMEGQQQEQQQQRRASVGIKGLVERRDGVPDARAGEELDRVFGGLDIK